MSQFMPEYSTPYGVIRGVGAWCCMASWGAGVSWGACKVNKGMGDGGGQVHAVNVQTQD